LYSRSKFMDDLAMMLGGRTAEEEKFNEITTGAENDLRKATKLARKMVTEFGMSKKLGPLTFGHKDELVFLGRELGEQQNYSEKIASEIDEEVSSIIAGAQQKAREVIKKHKDNLEKIAKKLIKEETIEGEEFEKIFEKSKVKKVEKVVTKDAKERKEKTKEQKGLEQVQKPELKPKEVNP